MVVRTKMPAKCFICEEHESKYKCSTCRVPYCSVACFHKHKETKCENIEESTNTTTEIENDTFITPDTVSQEKLVLLRNSSQVCNQLSNVHLRNMLENIDKSTDPNGIMEKAMQEPIFLEFANTCLDLIEPNDNCT